jgi:hypothetical protein
MQSNPIPFVGPGGAAQALQLTLVVNDPEVIVELERHPVGTPRNEYAVRALRVGSLCLRDAAGSIDADAIRKEGDRLVGSVREILSERTHDLTKSLATSLAHYFDPSSGALPQRLERLVQRDGELDGLLTRHLSGEGSTIARTLAEQIGTTSPIFKLLSPDQADGVVGAIAKTVGKALEAQRDAVVSQFSLDRPDSALSRLVVEVQARNGTLRDDLRTDVQALASEFSLDNENGALARLVGRVEKAQRTIVEQFSLDQPGTALRKITDAIQKTDATIRASFTLDDKQSPLSRLRGEVLEVIGGLVKSNTDFQSDMRKELAQMQVKRAEQARTAAHGRTFEASLHEVLEREAARAGDVYESVGARPARGTRKVGDGIVTLGPESAAPGVRIACEAKADKSYTSQQALKEIALAREIRQAQVGLFVIARASASEGWEPMRRIGEDVFVVWDADDPTSDIYLKAGLSVARAIAVRTRVALEANEEGLAQIEAAILALRKVATRVDTIERSARLVTRHGTTILDSAESMRGELDEQVEALGEAVSHLRGAIDAGATAS